MRLRQLTNGTVRAFTKYAWWQTVIFIVGILAILSVVGALFFAAGSNPDRFYVDGPMPAAASPDFAQALAHAVNAPLEQGGTIQALNNGTYYEL